MPSQIRLLEPELINRIAAGEVVERPTSALKELLENALDAGASEISMTLQDGGQSLIRIQDNGIGMTRDDLRLAVQRHSTSKLPEGDLWNIQSFGFRGEALASISAVARVTLSSKTAQDEHGWSLTIEGGQETEQKPVAMPTGTCVEVRDLFFATPARLKFLKSPTQEQLLLSRLLNRFMLLYPQVSFHLNIEGKYRHFPSTTLEARIEVIMKENPVQCGLCFQGSHADVSVEGWGSLPSVHRRNADYMFFFVNGRPVEDRMLLQTARVAYGDRVPKERTPHLVLHLKVPTEDLDVNVHPAKTQVRFKDSQAVRQALHGTLSRALFQNAHRSAEITAPSMVSAPLIRPPKPAPPPSAALLFQQRKLSLEETSNPTLKAVHPPFATATPRPAPHFTQLPVPPSAPQLEPIDLGRAITQLHQRYILAVNGQGLVVVDPHGAQERMRYEQMKQTWQAFDIQLLLHPITLRLDSSEKDALKPLLPALREVGFPVSAEEELWTLEGTPAIFHRQDPLELWDSVLQALESEAGHPAQDIVETLLHKLLAHWACRSSIFLGDKLSLEEMNQLLRDLERTPNSAQCNHGRRVYRVFSLEHIGRWFDR